MAKKKQSFTLPNTEVLIVLVLVFSFITIAVFRCNSTKRSYQEIEEQVESDGNREAETDAVSATPSTPVTSPASTPPVSAPTTTYTPPPAPPTSVISKLYVTLEDLNLRTGPHLDSTSIGRLPLFDEVFFMNEVTDFTQKISLGPEVADEPWIKIRTRKGRIGWVYGAGVNYYKKRRIPTTTTVAPSGSNAQ